MPAGQRERLERVCRYALRPPVARDRLRVTGDGQVLLHLRHRWTDGTTHLVFDPIEFLGRLAVLVPRPRINLILYHGMLGPRALEAGYFALGEHDVYLIVDAPDNASVTAIALATNASGAVRVNTTVLLTPQEVDAAAKKPVKYTPPGR